MTPAELRQLANKLLLTLSNIHATLQSQRVVHYGSDVTMTEWNYDA